MLGRRYTKAVDQLLEFDEKNAPHEAENRGMINFFTNARCRRHVLTTIFTFIDFLTEILQTVKDKARRYVNSRKVTIFNLHHLLHILQRIFPSSETATLDTIIPKIYFLVIF